MSAVRVVIADDHPPTRAGLRATLEEHGFEIVAEAGDSPSAVEASEQTKPDIVLLDINMPGSGIAAAARIAEGVPDTAVVMLTVSRDDSDLFDALRAGAQGYLLKDIDPARLPSALQGVLDGEAALPRTLTARLVDEFRQRERGRRLLVLGRRGVRLTEREWEVLELMRDGATTAEIAERTFVSSATVRTHVSAILRKLKVKSRSDALQLLQESESD